MRSSALAEKVPMTRCRHYSQQQKAIGSQSLKGWGGITMSIVAPSSVLLCRPLVSHFASHFASHFVCRFVSTLRVKMWHKHGTIRELSQHESRILTALGLTGLIAAVCSLYVNVRKLPNLRNLISCSPCKEETSRTFTHTHSYEKANCQSAVVKTISHKKYPLQTVWQQTWKLL